ncbi:MAG: YkgJ family cysteine cluster protein [Desulfobacterales bacterium]
MPCEPPEPEDLFECLRCGECCRGYGGTYVSASDIENIAAYTGIPPGELVNGYCTVSAGKYLLRQKSDGYCIFWEGVCTIHPVKPRMCKAWPFIENLLREPSNWQVMAQACPGMRKGVYEKDVIRCVKRKLYELKPHEPLLHPLR